MPDLARAYTDRKLKKLERELERVYARAQSNVAAEWARFERKYGKKAAELFRAWELAKLTGDVQAIAEAEAAYRAEVDRVMNSANSGYVAVVAAIVAIIVAADLRAFRLVNQYLPGIYARNYNSAAADIPMSLGISFEVIDATLVRNLREARYDLLAGEAWTRQRLNAIILQGRLNGESIPQIARRLESLVGGNRVAAIRSARTAVTYAENQATLDSIYELRDKYGLVYDKQWISTHDSRTRDSHVKIDGDIQHPQDPFIVGESESRMMCPGDPAGAPEEVYNCRCRMNRVLVGLLRADGTVAPWTGHAPSSDYVPYRLRRR